MEGGDCEDPDVPNRSYGDYFCKICDSHMNSENMWEAHVTGKRHIKNVKKGDTDSKYEELPNIESNINSELKNIKDEPIVGLSYIHEIRRKEPNVPPIFNCFLCHASIATVPLVTEHLMSLKHRLNYVKENNPEECELIEATNLKKGQMEPLVISAARDLEQKLGRGTVKVKQEKKKSAVVTYSGKKSFNLDDEFDDSHWESYKNKNSKFGSNDRDHWKSVDTGKNYRRRERSRSPRDFNDDVILCERSRSPRELKERWPLYSDEETSLDGYNKRSFPKSREEDYGRHSSLPNRDISHDDYERHQSFSKRAVSPRRDDYERHQSFSKRAISPRGDDYERQQSFSKRAVSPRGDDYERHKSFSKRAVSPREDDYERHRSFSKKDISPNRDDFLYRSTESYSNTSKKPDLRDKLNYMASASYEHGGSVKKSFDSYVDNQKSASFLSKKKPAASPIEQKTVQSVFNDTLILTSEECYKLLLDRLASLPEISSLEELILVTKLIHEAQKKLKNKLSEEVIAAISLRASASNVSSNIPGLGDGMSSNSEPPQNSYKSQQALDAASFIHNIFKSASISPVSKMTAPQNTRSYISQPFQNSLLSSQPVAPASSYLPPTASTFQAPTASSSFEAPAASSYQAPAASSYQAPDSSSYQVPAVSTFQGQSASYRNMPFPSTSSNYSQKVPQDPQVYNYSHISSASKNNYPNKY